MQFLPPCNPHTYTTIHGMDGSKFDCESSWWKMAFNNGNDDAQAQAQPQNPKKNLSNLNLSPSPSPPPQAQNGVSKVKSCRGSLYYSSLRKSKSKSPTCVGFSGTLDQYLSDNVGGAELRDSKQGMNLANFKYACLGYSIYLDNKNSSADSQNKAPKLPLCVGLQMLTLKKPSVSPIGQVPDPACKSEEQEHATSQPQSYKPPHVTEEKNFNRFKRNASLVASGIGRNLNRVGNYVRERSGPK